MNAQRPTHPRATGQHQSIFSWLNNLGFFAKMIIPIVFVIATLGFLLWSGVQRQTDVTTALTDLSRLHIPALDSLLEADRDLYQAQVAERSMIMTRVDSEFYQSLRKDHEANIEQARTRLGKFASLNDHTVDKARVEDMLSRLDVWATSSREVIALRETDTDDSRRKAVELSLGKTNELFQRVRDMIDQFGELQLVASTSAVETEQLATEDSRKLMIILGSVGIVTCTLTLLLLARLVTTRLHEVVDSLKDIASGQGDLTARLRLSGRDEIGQLAAAFNQFVSRIHDMVLTAKLASVAVANATSEMAQGNYDLAMRTESQAEGLQQTSGSMKALTASVQQNADSAARAADLAKNARDMAERGGKQVDEVIVAMRNIADSSRKISQIVGAVDEIAFQTNLLALNAAVEAARAGEQGVGFAVVATEVRNLAQRSAASASEIKRLIHDSLKIIEQGANIADRSGDALNEVVASVESVSLLITEISEESREQSNGIAGVDQSLSSIEEITQRNAALVEEAAVSMEQLKEQAEGLHEELSFFRLSDSLGGQRASAPPSAARKGGFAPRHRQFRPA